MDMKVEPSKQTVDGVPKSITGKGFSLIVTVDDVKLEQVASTKLSIVITWPSVMVNEYVSALIPGIF